MLTQIIIWLNVFANAVGAVCLAPVAVLPGWLSATLIAAVTGVLMLLAFKYTSNQSAIKRVRADIKANTLAISLFRDNTRVSMKSVGGVVWGALRLMFHAIVPMLVMIVPVCLLLGQLSLWYQARPLAVGEEGVITMQLRDDVIVEDLTLQLQPSAAIDVTVGPVRVPSKHWVCWNLAAREPGYHTLRFDVSGEAFEKELAVGDGFMQVSVERPAWEWTTVLLHPREQPFASDSSVQSIQVAYPERLSWVAGTHSWLIFWFIASIVFAFVARPWLGVNL
jgi:hypothetical protein